ncbi:hypothetical protein LCGC14_0302880 [marine sediment metagenome]|uniref:Uncharacterized protein n=1 Tax=marine sediment metagenome TaxID=412755 RepID=A0A0F9WB83_9ZZZZ
MHAKINWNYSLFASVGVLFLLLVTRFVEGNRKIPDSIKLPLDILIIITSTWLVITFLKQRFYTNLKFNGESQIQKERNRNYDRFIAFLIGGFGAASLVAGLPYSYITSIWFGYLLYQLHWILILRHETLDLIGSEEFDFIALKDEEFPLELLKKAMLYGRDNPFPSGTRSKYRPEKHWQIAYDYLIKRSTIEMIAEDLGVTDQLIGNGYVEGGCIAIVLHEQMGHWVEPFIPDYNPDYDPNWQEIKIRRRKEIPMKSWIGDKMVDHVMAGGEAILYQVIINRKTSRIITYNIKQR